MPDLNDKISFKKTPNEENPPRGKIDEPLSQPKKEISQSKKLLEKVMEVDPFANADAYKKPFIKPFIKPEKTKKKQESSKAPNPFLKPKTESLEKPSLQKYVSEENVIAKVIDESSTSQPKKIEAPLKTPPKNKLKIEVPAENLPVSSPPENSASQMPKVPKIVLEKKGDRGTKNKKIFFQSDKSTPPPPPHKPRAEVLESGGDNKDNPPTKGLSAQKLLFWFLGLGGVFVFLFYAIIFWGTVSGNASNPLFETLGVAPEELQSLLLSMTNIIFGLLSLIFLIITLTLLFRGFMARKEDANKRQLFATTGIYFIIFILGVALWVFLFWFISNLSSGPIIKEGQSLIDTIPKSVIDLDAPSQVEFSISERLNEIIKPENLRQINWDFDEDGIFDASGIKVTHRFLDKGINNGIYKVKASIRYYSEQEGEEDVYETVRQVVINNESVLAVLTATPSSGTYPLEVELSGIESKDPDGSIVWYEWDLDGDGTFEVRKEDPLIKTTFETVGKHKVTLRVTGTNTDDYDVVEKTITVRNPEGSLRAEISTDGISEGLPPLKVTFDGSNSFVKEGKILRYEWIVDNSDEPVVGRKMEKVFRTPGEHVIRLIVQNDLGEKHEVTKIIKVLQDETPDIVTIDTTPEKVKDEEILRGIVPFEVTFNAENSEVKDAFEWQWDFQNDGITDEFAIAAKHIFRKPGTYDVRLSIVDAEEKVHEKIQRVIVERSGLRAKISANPNAGEVPLQISFDGSGSSTDEGTIVDYIWEFPDTEPIHYGSKISYLFKQIGNFPVKLTVLTSTGKIATTSTIVSSRAPNVRSEFLYSPKVGSAPLNVTFNPTSSKGLVREYLWDFGDGTLKKQYRATAVEHLYKKEGTYTVKLRLIDDNGVVSSAEQTVEVRPTKR